MRNLGDGWTDDHDRQYREELERRFRERTPPKMNDPYSFDPAARVGRAEMRTWCDDALGVRPPEYDEDWVKQNARWYFYMSKRVRKELGED